MITSIKPNKSTTFTSRSPQVRDADWVCRTINHNLPHFSSTKMQPFIENYLKRNASEINYKGELGTLSEIYNFLSDIIFQEGNQKLIDTIYSIKKMITKFGEKRLLANEIIATGTINDILYESMFLMLKEKLGNCTENAVIAELICKLNGLKNTTCAIVNKINTKQENPKIEHLDHFVCVLNTDNSKFNGKINKKTIIIDPWLGKADFANNMEQFFRNECANFFELTEDDKFYYQTRELVNLSEDELIDFRNELDDFIFKNKTRKFMQK